MVRTHQAQLPHSPVHFPRWYGWLQQPKLPALGPPGPSQPSTACPAEDPGHGSSALVPLLGLTIILALLPASRSLSFNTHANCSSIHSVYRSAVPLHLYLPLCVDVSFSVSLSLSLSTSSCCLSVLSLSPVPLFPILSLSYSHTRTPVYAYARAHTHTPPPPPPTQNQKRDFSHLSEPYLASLPSIWELRPALVDEIDPSPGCIQKEPDQSEGLDRGWMCRTKRSHFPREKEKEGDRQGGKGLTAQLFLLVSCDSPNIFCHESPLLKLGQRGFFCLDYGTNLKN